MKKLLTAIAGILLAACLAVTLVACSTDVDGKTYVYDSIVGNAAFETDFKAMEITFKDGKVSMNGEEISYKQYGDTVTVEGQTMKVDGKKLTMSMTQDGITVKVTFKQK
ncbi:MAG TPA: hypothetical protein H9728_03345 [Candidatus Borkfalkia excrementavium]|uniref:Lipocalin-like domain-containing protein n=1 Tax=Candidatus Borkfalkia excrementavium TaxID=2838505 RepID=A0A9D1Z8M3_9FIRM|nr:hypothetical protein [Candidatus Borkfalkia excrementavium]